MLSFQALFAAFRRFNADEDWALASHIALSTLMALFPFMIVMSSLAHFLGASEVADDVVGLMFDTWPQQVADRISSEIHEILTTNRSNLLTINLVLATYFASSGIESLRIGFNRAYGVVEQRSWIVLQFKSIVYVLITAVALMTLGFLIVLGPLVFAGAYEAFPGLLLQELSPLVDDKANLAPLRLASFLALAVTAGHLVRRNNRLLHTPVARLIIRCGQHSLQVFCLGVLLAVLGEILLSSVRDDIAMQLAISLAGIVLMIAIGGLLTWYNEGNAMRSDAIIAADTNAAR